MVSALEQAFMYEICAIQALYNNNNNNYKAQKLQMCFYVLYWYMNTFFSLQMELIYN